MEVDQPQQTINNNAAIVEIDKDIDSLCSSLENMKILNITNELFRFLFQWNPNLEISHQYNMTQIKFNSVYYNKFCLAIQAFNKNYSEYNITHSVKHDIQSYYDFIVNIYIKTASTE